LGNSDSESFCWNVVAEKWMVMQMSKNAKKMAGRQEKPKSGPKAKIGLDA
jgi:hypothetical protein